MEVPEMQGKYFLALFTEKTWTEFCTHKKKIYGTSKNKLSRASVLINGDFLLCYVSKKKEIVGVLEVISEAYYDEAKIWEEQIFPVRVAVKPISILPLGRGIPISKFFNDLNIFKNLKNKKNWSGFFHNTFNTFPDEDGKFIMNELKKISIDR